MTSFNLIKYDARVSVPIRHPVAAPGTGMHAVHSIRQLTDHDRVDRDVSEVVYISVDRQSGRAGWRSR